MASLRSIDKVFPMEEPEFQVAPMIDVLLVLMTFFMSITSTEVLKTKTTLPIHLPVATASKAKELSMSEVLLNISWIGSRQQGVIEFEERTIHDPAEITQIILQRKSNQPYFRAVVRADENVPYSFVQQVMLACAAGQVDNITFSVLSRESATRRKK